jgi:hypothetical protein
MEQIDGYINWSYSKLYKYIHDVVDDYYEQENAIVLFDKNELSEILDIKKIGIIGKGLSGKNIKYFKLLGVMLEFIRNFIKSNDTTANIYPDDRQNYPYARSSRDELGFYCVDIHDDGNVIIWSRMITGDYDLLYSFGMKMMYIEYTDDYFGVVDINFSKQRVTQRKMILEPNYKLITREYVIYLNTFISTIKNLNSVIIDDIIDLIISYTHQGFIRKLMKSVNYAAEFSELI